MENASILFYVFVCKICYKYNKFRYDERSETLWMIQSISWSFRFSLMKAVAYISTKFVHQMSGITLKWLFILQHPLDKSTAVIVMQDHFFETTQHKICFTTVT